MKGELGPSLQTDTEDVDEAVRLVHVPLSALAVTGQEDFGLRRRPVDRCHRSVIVRTFVLEDELFVQFTASFQSIVIFSFIFFSKELVHQVEFLAECALNKPRTIIEEALEVGPFHDLLSFLFGHLHNFHFFKLLLLLALRAELVLARPIFLEVAVPARGRFSWHSLTYLALHAFEALIEVVLEATILVILGDSIESVDLCRVNNVACDLFVISLGRADPGNLQFNYVRGDSEWELAPCIACILDLAGHWQRLRPHQLLLGLRRVR